MCVCVCAYGCVEIMGKCGHEVLSKQCVQKLNEVVHTFQHSDMLSVVGGWRRGERLGRENIVKKYIADTTNFINPLDLHTKLTTILILAC